MRSCTDRAWHRSSPIKTPKPWYRKQTDAWYVCIAGLQRPLGKHPAGPPPRKDRGEWRPPAPILRAYHRLMAGEGLATPLEARSLRGLVEEFLVDSALSNAAKTVA